MNLRRWALTYLFVMAVTDTRISTAGTWGMDPSVGVLGDYATNPELVHAPNTEVLSGAFLLDAPTIYDDGPFRFDVLPSFRVGNSRGTSTQASDYEHLDLKGEWDSDISSLGVKAGIAHDSSLAYNFLINESGALERYAATADVLWDIRPTERWELQTDLNYQRVRFSKLPGVSSLNDYQSPSLSLAANWSASERTKLQLTGNVSNYESLHLQDDFGNPISYQSLSANLQGGFTTQLTELWSLSLLGGYSRAHNSDDRTEYPVVDYYPGCPLPVIEQGIAIFCIVPTPVTVKSTQNGSVYSAALNHQGTQLKLGLNASRQLTPTGFAYLTRQDAYEGNATYTLNERWSFGATLRWQRYQNPPGIGAPPEVIVRYGGINADWAWTEKWTVILGVARVADSYSASSFNVASNEVSVTLSRRFDHITLD
jgi:hypothetical protein